MKTTPGLLCCPAMGGDVLACLLPPGALLQKYAQGGAFTDCYAIEVPGTVSQARFVEAFYCGRLFRLERLLIRLFLSRASTDAQVRELAAGQASDFAAWRVEERRPDQLLMCDIVGRTRSWLMTVPDDAKTRLYFGSAVVPVRDPKTGQAHMGRLFDALHGFHRLYSRLLLAGARSRLQA